ncbi:MAG: hypothetical protein ABDH21_02340 [bacterium]
MGRGNFTRGLVFKIIIAFIIFFISLVFIEGKKVEKFILSSNFGNPLGRNIDNVDEGFDSALVLDNIAGGVISDIGNALFVAPDNQVFICGHSFNGQNLDPILINIDTDGKLNPNFGKNGIVVIDKVDDIHLFDSNSLYVRDQKIYLIGSYWQSKGFVARFNYKGDLDISFGQNGIVKISNNQQEIVSLEEIYVDKDHYVYVVGNREIYPFLLKLDQNGNFDKTFGSEGFLSLQTSLKEEYVIDLIFDNQQKMLVAGSGVNPNHPEPNKDVFIIKLNQDGSIDTSFANNGKIIFDYNSQEDQFSDSCIDENNNLYVAINTEKTYFDIILLKYDQKGDLDTSFGSNGMVLIDNIAGGKTDDIAKSIKTDNKGRIYIAGHSVNSELNSELIVGRINTKGKIDNSFVKNGFIIVSNIAGGNYADVALSMDLDKNLNIFVTGFSTGKYYPNIPKQNTDLIVLKIENI